MTEQAPSGVKLPASVRAQVDAANQLIKDLNAPPAAARPGSVSASGQQWQAASPAPAHAAGEPPPPPAHAAAPPAAPSVEERLRQAEARYASLQGKYNAETGALRSQVEQNTQLVSQLLARDAAAAAAPPASVPASPQSPEDFLKSLGATDGDIKDYGDLLPIIVRLAQNMYKPTLQKLENELQSLRNSAAAGKAGLDETRRQNIFAALDSSVSAWRTINESDHFLDWLKIVDIFSGVTRHVALATAFKNLDLARVVAIFEAYAREYPEQARAPGAPAVDPATLVAPEIRGDQPPAAPEGSGSKRIISETEIRNFYARVRKKLVTKEEYQRFQDEVAKATAEGRVRPDRPDHHANR